MRLAGQQTERRFGKLMNMKRMRGRNQRPGGGSGGGGGGSVPIRHQGGAIPLNRNLPFDSSGPDLRIRGTAQQLFEKYLQLGRDATGVGDRVTAESYFQYAEHYFRILNAMNQAQQGGSSGGQQGRRPSMHESQQDYDNDGEDQDSQPAGSGDQPNGHGDARDIPITSGASND